MAKETISHFKSTVLLNYMCLQKVFDKDCKPKLANKSRRKAQHLMSTKQESCSGTLCTTKAPQLHNPTTNPPVFSLRN